MTNILKSLRRFFEDKDGHIVIWQSPNPLLYGWGIGKLLAMFVKQHPWNQGFSQLSMALLFAWAYLELTIGVSYFRRVLGAGIFLSIVVGFFR